MSDPIKFSHLGLECEIHLQPNGHYCGYVGVDVGHPAHGLDEEELDEGLTAHGGVTYSYLISDSDTWFFGFDCRHSGDGANSSQPNWRDAAYVHGECMKLANQLAAVKAPISYKGRPIGRLTENELRAALKELLSGKEPR